MDIRPAGSAIPQTSALDALRRVQSSAAAEDSEDSQTAGYLFGDGGKNPNRHSGAESDSETGEQPIEDAVDLSADTLANHAAEPHPPEPGNERASAVAPVPAAPERHLDIEA